MADISWLTRRPIAHRGLHDMNRAVWENTLSAFARAADQGYAIECDVHLTLDGEVVVFHDNDLARVCGEQALVWQRTLGEMAAARVGRKADHPPSLRELLDLVAGRVPLVIEIKGIPGHDEGLVAKVAEGLRGYTGKAAIMSFDHWIVRDFAAHFPDRPFGLTAWGGAQREVEAHCSMLAHGISFVSYDVEALDNAFVRLVRDRLNMPVISWTVRSQAVADRSALYAQQITFEGFVPRASETV